MSLHLVEVHLPKEFLLMSHGHELLTFFTLLFHMLKAGHLGFDVLSLSLDVRLDILAKLVLERNLLCTVVIDLLHERATGQFLLLPGCVALGPLTLGLFFLKALQFFLALRLAGHFKLQSLCERNSFLFGLLLLSLLLLSNAAFALDNAIDKVLVKLPLHAVFLLPLRLLNCHVLVSFLSVSFRLNDATDVSLLLLLLLLCPKLLHLFSLNCFLVLVHLHPLFLHVQLNCKSRFLLLVALTLHRLLPLFTFYLGKVAFVPQLGVKVIVCLFLGQSEGFVVKLEVPIGNGLELHNLRIHSSKIINACSPLRVQLLLHHCLTLILSAFLELICSS
mmetsp:Transcript_44607/g.80214  ORF Transcript_44607/g.80214 Transcript_44607/m.80214 type:complete len:333 (+) Transcript_44607:393-1391(+)